MSETTDDHVRTRKPAEGESRESGSQPLSILAPPAGVDTAGEDTVASLREDAHRLAVRCTGLEGLLTDGLKSSNSNDTRALLVATRDVRCACQHLLSVLGCETPNDSLIEATPKRVLVVDDRADSIDMVAAILEHAGFEVVTAANGLEGLLAAHRSRPVVILMDVQMPILDGIEATRLLKAATSTQDIPVIAHTARPDSCHLPPGRFFAHILPKPVNPDVLLALVQRYVRDKEGS